MAKKFLTLLLCWAVISGAPIWAKAPQQTKIEKYKKQVVAWGTNKNILVELNTKEKIEGRIATIKDDLFTLQFVKDSQITTREIRYDEVKKLSGKDGGKAGKIAGYTALGVLAGVGVFAVVMLSIWANN